MTQCEGKLVVHDFNSITLLKDAPHTVAKKVGCPITSSIFFTSLFLYINPLSSVRFSIILMTFMITIKP